MRQGTDTDGDVVSVWLFDPDGTVLAGPDGLVSHLVCGGVYDWSTGLLYKGERYFDPMLGIWLALLPLAVVQGRKKKRTSGHPWVVLVCGGVCVTGMLVGCCSTEPLPSPSEPRCSDFDLTMNISDGGLRLYEDRFKPTGWAYGKEVTIHITPEPTNPAYPLGEELYEKCSVVQWVEGCRKVDGQFVPDPNYPGELMNHLGVYKPDAKVGEFSYPEYLPYREYDSTLENIIALRHFDAPAQGLYSGQTLDVTESYITAIYNAEDIDRTWGSIPMSRDQVLSTPIVEHVEWNFVAYYTRP